jgi:hypothetical protein
MGTIFFLPFIINMKRSVLMETSATRAKKISKGMIK